jgi:hypothetical protein
LAFDGLHCPFWLLLALDDFVDQRPVLVIKARQNLAVSNKQFPNRYHQFKAL